MTDDEVPPPYSEQELDQKISHALVISAQEPRATQSHQGTTDDGEWEQWDEAAFAAAEANNRRAQGLDARSSASYLYAQSHEEVGSSPFPVPSAVAPLRIHKRGGKSSSSASGYDGTFGSPGSSSSGHVLWKTQHEIPVDSDDETNDRSIPPPPFASMGPRMDGIVRLEYHPESTPPSPLNSPVSEHRLPLAPDPSFSLHPQTSSNPRRLSPQTQPHSPHKAPRQSLPIPPRSPNYHLEQRSISTFHPHQSMARTQPPVTMPPHNVDRLRQYTVSTLPPSSSQIQPPTHTVSLSALTKVDQTFPTTPQTQSYTLGALYNSSVSAHLSSPMSMQPRASHSARQYRLSQSTQPQTGQHAAIHPTTATPSTNYNIGRSAPMPQVPPGSFISQNPANTTHYPQYPSYEHSGSTVPRWATSEQQYNQNFR